MPAWATPEFEPDWWAPSVGSRSRTTIRASGSRCCSSRAVANPRIPPPTTATSHSPVGSACCIGGSYGARIGHDGETQMARVLVTGASGYVGAALLPRLRAAGHEVRAFARSPERVAAAGVDVAGLEVLTGDAVTGVGLDVALDGIDVAYFLIHSMEAAAGDGF